MGELHMWDGTRGVLSRSWSSSLQLHAWFMYRMMTAQKGLLMWKSIHHKLSSEKNGAATLATVLAEKGGLGSVLSYT